ncbi:uncharacterized protein LOC108433483 [Pygocentrus nattereri]|uniref:uncharacterized protein LOC108433483 n=1 Tax=Pygocentrus nattereri TaxID=42514 RepID=UPI0008143B2D|nr:uncharacterized protein LOC108433483 [Pygocentrus nattereri]
MSRLVPNATESRLAPNTTEPAAIRATRHDWILYTVPSIAFVIGLMLFALIYKTQRHRETKTIRRVPAVKTTTNGTTAKHNDTRPGFTEAQMEKEADLKKQEAQSYENVSAAIYSNQDKVTYYVTQDEDYITPVEMGDAVTASEQNDNTYLLPQNITDIDGESYENMDGCVYAQPRNNTQKHTLSADDDESYENMEGNACSFRPPATYNSTNTLDDESYERMDSIQTPSDRWMERNARETERRAERDRQEKQWYFRQKTV